MRWYVSAAIVLALAVGVYLRVVTFDPVSAVLLVVVLLNNHNLMQRQEQTAELIRKHHDVTTSNDKVIADMMKQIRNMMSKFK